MINDPEREHMKRMLRHLSEQCDHKYVEREMAPLGVTCVKCGDFVGAHETEERVFDVEDAEEWQRRADEENTFEENRG